MRYLCFQFQAGLIIAFVREQELRYQPRPGSCPGHRITAVTGRAHITAVLQLLTRMGSCMGRALSWERPQRGCSQEACRQQSQGDKKRIKMKVQSSRCCDQRNPTRHEVCLLEASHSLLEVPWHHGLNSSRCWKGSPALIGGTYLSEGTQFLLHQQQPQHHQKPS